MRFRFAEKDELAIVTDLFPLLGPSDGHCSSPTSVDSTFKFCSGVADTGAIPHSKEVKAKLECEITTLRAKRARLAVAEKEAKCSTRKNGKAKPKWKSIAIQQMQLRQRAERDNKRLRRMLTAQHLLAKSILNGRVDLLRAIPKRHRRACHRQTK
ncbi:hypothetical protein PHMEG_00022733 [Phytophthora megakarya]|uniref:Uncharacterized protein n=1 Tax=Phytophthora megakarya TaxID=4795 RepID=A0A225VK08_9STRA|nr:hypothetical protein PHMEG_00022733 [Phytophthora megakarya]